MEKAKYPNIRKEMADRGETLKDLESILNLDKSNIGLRIRGKKEWTITEIEKLCNYFNKNYNELFKKED